MLIKVIIELTYHWNFRLVLLLVPFLLPVFLHGQISWVGPLPFQTESCDQQPQRIFASVSELNIRKLKIVFKLLKKINGGVLKQCGDYE